VPLEVGNEDINGIVLEFTDRISKVSGTVASPDGKPDSAAAVVLFPTDAKRSTDITALPPGFARGRVNPDGTYGLLCPPAVTTSLQSLRNNQENGETLSSWNVSRVSLRS
jgi:hypothetical protein